VRCCGIDVSGKPGNQQLVTLAERPAAEGAMELVATFYAPGTTGAVVATIEGFQDDVVVAVDAPSLPRRDLLVAGASLRDALGLPAGRYERMRVCDALLFRRGLPLYPVPAAGEPLTPWQGWMGIGFALFEALAGRLERYDPHAPSGEVLGRATLAAPASGRVCETYPDAVFCALLGHRPPPKRTPDGARQRIEALLAYGVRDGDGSLWRRTLDELDACAAACAAHALAAGRATWLGAPEEGVIVLPVEKLEDGYTPLDPPVRASLAAAGR
jgi:predicted nuclease with RNAse H fold